MESDGLVAVEKMFLELEDRQKEGKKLDQEEIDWLLYAENLLYGR
jgi:hypothetical protein